MKKQKIEDGQSVKTENTSVAAVDQPAWTQTLCFPSSLSAALQAQKFESLFHIASGSYGNIFEGREVGTNRKVAIKRATPAEEGSTLGVPVDVLREVGIMLEVDHPNVLTLITVYPDMHGTLSVVTELADSDLSKVIKRAGEGASVLTPAQVKRYMHCLFSGLVALHSRGFVHRDIKPSNLLVCRGEASLKIGDLGAVRPFAALPDESLTPLVGTLFYRAPEMLLGSKTYNEKVDIWAAGCLLAELTCGHYLFAGQGEVDVLASIFGLLGTPDTAGWAAANNLPCPVPFATTKPSQSLTRVLAPFMTADAISLMECLLALDPERRPSASEALQHPYFASDPPMATAAEMPNLSGL